MKSEGILFPKRRLLQRLICNVVDITSDLSESARNITEKIHIAGLGRSQVYLAAS